MQSSWLLFFLNVKDKFIFILPFALIFHGSRNAQKLGSDKAEILTSEQLSDFKNFMELNNLQIHICSIIEMHILNFWMIYQKKLKNFKPNLNTDI